MKTDVWSETRLSDMVTAAFAGAWGESPSDAVKANIHVLRATNIDTDGGLDYVTAAPRVLPERDLNRKQLASGDLIVEASGGGPGTPVGRVALFVGGAEGVIYTCSNFFRVLRPNQELVDPAYLALFLVRAYRSSVIWRYQQQTTGIVNLKFVDYMKQPVPLPPLAEQRRIVKVAGAVMRQEKTIETSIEKLSKIRSSLAARITEPLTAGTMGRVGEVFDVGAGITLGADRSPKMIKRTYLRVANVQRGRIDVSSLAEVEQFPGDEAKYTLKEGDLLLVEGHANPDEIGRCAVVTKREVGHFHQNHLFRLRTTRSLPEFSELWLNSDAVRSYWRKVAATSSGLYTISRRLVDRVPFPVTDLDEQRRLVEPLSSCRQQIEDERKMLEKLRELRQGLVDNLLTFGF